MKILTPGRKLILVVATIAAFVGYGVANPAHWHWLWPVGWACVVGAALLP